jgi:8-oxo-dGTP pyrophosphatase MutT (NUDIX family)
VTIDHERRAKLRRVLLANFDSGPFGQTPFGGPRPHGPGRGAGSETEFDQIVNELIEIPAIPPTEWFASLHDSEPYDVVVEMNGHIHGFPAASWNDCHLSYPDQCVTPPRSATDYTLFKVGQLVTASGAVVRTGPITLKGGHAPHGVSRQQAQKFYDDTDSAIADVAIGDGTHGIWINGAIRPDVSVADVRRAMSSGFSGDWREWQGNLELIAFSAVNTPGFRRKAALYEVPVSMAASADTSGWGTLCASIDMPVGVDSSGVVIRALDTGRLLLTQRSLFHGDDDAVKGKWEFPGGKLEEGEDAEIGALREFNEETGLVLPDGWSKVGEYPTGNYVSILFDVPNEGWATAAVLDPTETAGIGWFEPGEIAAIVRPECADFDADAVWAEMAELEGPTEDFDAVMASAVERVARSIGRSRNQIAEQLRSRVHV